jgi:hypothetical protein
MVGFVCGVGLVLSVLLGMGKGGGRGPPQMLWERWEGSKSWTTWFLMKRGWSYNIVSLGEVLL